MSSPVLLRLDREQEDHRIKAGRSELTESLGAMMQRFTEASTRLSDRHSTLTAEIESLHERLRIKDEELARAERLSTLGATAAALAHEVRNPLGSIKLFISLLREDLIGNNSGITLVDSIDRSVSNLDHVVTNMLQFAADKPCRLQLCTPSTVITDIVNQLTTQHPDLVVSVRGDLVQRAMFDDSALRQIVLNILRNAGQAMRWKGAVTITIATTNDYWTMTIADTGPGIQREVMPRLFDPFVTGRQEGTGLGLAIVKRLVEQHRGSITARNGEHGAVFEIRFLKGVL